MASVIHGYFSETGEPYIAANVILPDLMALAGPLPSVSFLVDTGASSTILHPMGALDLGIDLSKLDYPELSAGIGGFSYDALADGVVLFRGDGFGFMCPVSIRIAQPTEHNMTLPSLLGRDVLRQCNMRYEPENGILQLISNASTLVIPQS